MKYAGMPFGMWTLFAPSFRNQLTAVFGYGTNTAKAITKKAKLKYREIISELPEFEKGDRFKMNLVNCSMIGAFMRLNRIHLLGNPRKHLQKQERSSQLV